MYRNNKPIHLSPYDHPDIYPGPRPSSSFVFHNGQAHRLELKKGQPLEKSAIHLSANNEIAGSLVTAGFEQAELAAYLDRYNFPHLEDRVPVVAYGSNVCLAQLQYKFSLDPSLNDPFIAIRSTITDSDIVYGSFLAPYGALPAVIAPVKGAETEVWVTLVDRNQLELVNRTEASYELRKHTGKKVVLENGQIFDTLYAYYYPKALKWDGTMTRYKDIPGNSPLPSVWESDMINRLKDEMKFNGTREEFIHSLRWDIDFKFRVNELLKQSEELFNHPDWETSGELLTMYSIESTFKEG